MRERFTVLYCQPDEAPNALLEVPLEESHSDGGNKFMSRDRAFQIVAENNRNYLLDETSYLWAFVVRVTRSRPLVRELGDVTACLLWGVGQLWMDVQFDVEAVQPTDDDYRKHVREVA